MIMRRGSVLDWGPMKQLSVLVLEDDAVVRRAVCERIAAEPAFSIAGEAGSLAQARALLSQKRPDLAVLDLHLPDGTALSLLPDLRAQGIASLVLTVSADDRDVYSALAAGAGGYLLKDEALSS